MSNYLKCCWLLISIIVKADEWSFQSSSRLSSHHLRCLESWSVIISNILRADGWSSQSFRKLNSDQTNDPRGWIVIISIILRAEREPSQSYWRVRSKHLKHLESEESSSRSTWKLKYNDTNFWNLKINNFNHSEGWRPIILKAPRQPFGEWIVSIIIILKSAE
jgi:hypothetical protein